jgi:hypothetical protein
MKKMEIEGQKREYERPMIHIIKLHGRPLLQIGSPDYQGFNIEEDWS